MSEDIFREVDEDMRQERNARLWRTYGIYVIGLAALIVLATAGSVGWRAYQDRLAHAEGEKFAAAFELAQAGKKDAAAKAFAVVAAEARGGYKALAALQNAAELGVSDRAAAIKAYDQMIADPGAARRFRDLAQVLAVTLLVDSAPAADLDARLKTLGPDSVWRFSGRELSALVRLKAGDTKEAAALFRALADDATAPAGIRARAAEMLAALGNSK